MIKVIIWIILSIIYFYFTSDTNECDKGVCQNGADCENNHGSFRCICSQGYYGSLCEMGENFTPCHRSSPAHQSASEKHTTWSEFACPPISIQKAQSRRKSPQTFAHLGHVKISVILSAEQTNFSHVLAAWSAFRALFTWSRRTTCAKDHRLF